MRPNWPQGRVVAVSAGGRAERRWTVHLPRRARRWTGHRRPSSRFTYARTKSGAEFSAYVGKGSTTYAARGYRTDVDDALRLNGGRVGHFSRGFFPNGVRRAEVESLASFSDATSEPSPWITRIWS